ncbi:hypothetical protein D3C78_1224340 [compost metagenome]
MPSFPHTAIQAGISSSDMTRAAARPTDMKMPKLRMLTMLVAVEIRKVAMVVTVVSTTGIIIRRMVARLASRLLCPAYFCS